MIYRNVHLAICAIIVAVLTHNRELVRHARGSQNVGRQP